MLSRLGQDESAAPRCRRGYHPAMTVPSRMATSRGALAALCAASLAACEPRAEGLAPPAISPPPRATVPDVWLDAQPPTPAATAAPAVSDDPTGKDFADEVRLLY